MLPMLEILDVSNNKLDGDLPTQWEAAKLVELDAHDNALTGQLPASLAQLPRLAYLQLQVTLGSWVLAPQTVWKDSGTVHIAWEQGCWQSLWLARRVGWNTLWPPALLRLYLQ